MKLPKQGLNLHRGNPINIDILQKIANVKNINLSESPDREIAFYSSLGHKTKLKYVVPTNQQTGHIVIIKIRHPNYRYVPISDYQPHKNLVKPALIPRNIILEITAHYQTAEQVLTESGTQTVNINDFESFTISIGSDGFYDHTSKKFNVVLFYYRGIGIDPFFSLEGEIIDPNIAIMVLPKVLFLDSEFSLQPQNDGTANKNNILDYAYAQATERNLKILDVRAITTKNVFEIEMVNVTSFYGFGLYKQAISRQPGSFRPRVLNYKNALIFSEISRMFFNTKKPLEFKLYRLSTNSLFIFPRNTFFIDYRI